MLILSPQNLAYVSNMPLWNGITRKKINEHVLPPSKQFGNNLNQLKYWAPDWMKVSAKVPVLLPSLFVTI